MGDPDQLIDSKQPATGDMVMVGSWVIVGAGDIRWLDKLQEFGYHFLWQEMPHFFRSEVLDPSFHPGQCLKLNSKQVVPTWRSNIFKYGASIHIHIYIHTSASRTLLSHHCFVPYGSTWWFLKMGVPPNHPRLILLSTVINQWIFEFPISRNQHSQYIPLVIPIINQLNQRNLTHWFTIVLAIQVV